MTLLKCHPQCSNMIAGTTVIVCIAAKRIDEDRKVSEQVSSCAFLFLIHYVIYKNDCPPSV